MENKGTVLILKQNSIVPHTNIEFKVGQEFEIVVGVVYMNGYPLPFNIQQTMLNWINNNPNLFLNDTRNW